MGSKLSKSPLQIFKSFILQELVPFIAQTHHLYFAFE